MSNRLPRFRTVVKPLVSVDVNEFVKKIVMGEEIRKGKRGLGDCGSMEQMRWVVGGGVMREDHER
ncbi:hypothetical protein RRG08_023475 [Elysia crispata]|uniref:Uncharacterized protein n=1 Tax=Elysia crispata TaxID=231223 RepID=A0AAE1ADX2_9GAST|nr:hypothetical protein RRG08_023475 [Elysia crispata]